MTDKEAMKLALEFIERVNKDGWILADFEPQMYEAITALKERLLEAPMREVQRLGQEIEQEPVCPACKAEVLYECVACSSNNYPPQRTWVGLTFAEICECENDYLHLFARAIEAKLKQKNGYAEEKNT